jgi:lipopolysaccharide exporter
MSGPMQSESLLNSALWSTYGAIVTRVLALVSNLLLARLLTPEEFGVIAIAYIFWALVNLFTQGTVGSFLMYKGVGDDRYLNTTFSLALLTGGGLSLGLMAMAPMLAQFFHLPDLVGLLAIFAVSLLLSFTQSVGAGVLNREMRQKDLAQVTTVASLVRVLVTVVCALFGLSYWSFALGDLAHWIAAAILTNRQVEHRFRLAIDPEIKGEVLRYCLGATGFSFSFFINANADNFVIGRLMSHQSLGFYNFAYQVSTALTLILRQTIEQVGTTRFAQLPDGESQRRSVLKLVTHGAWMAAPVYGLMALLLRGDLVSFIFGSKWIPACAVMPWLLLYSYFRLMNNSLFSMLSARGRPDISARINVVITPVAVCGFIWGAMHQDINQVAIAVGLLLGVLGSLMSWFMGCRALGWPVGAFWQASFIPAMLATSLVGLVWSYSWGLQIAVFLTLYGLGLRLLSPGIFKRYVQRLTKCATADEA